VNVGQVKSSLLALEHPEEEEVELVLEETVQTKAS